MSGNQPTAAPAGTPAERLHSLLVAATSLCLRVADHRADLVGRHRVVDGRLTVELPARSRIAQHLLRYGDAVAVVEVTDLVPTPVRDRVRARATLTGWLMPVDSSPADPGRVDPDPVGPGPVVRDPGQPAAVSSGVPELSTVFDLALAELVTGETVSSATPEEFAAARPDPLAGSEAALLCHLDDHHPETVRMLARLAAGDQTYPVRAIRPVALDRLGLTLRLEFPERDRDVRLAFPAPLHRPEQVAEGIRALLAGSAGSARSCQRSSTPTGTGTVAGERHAGDPGGA